MLSFQIAEKMTKGLRELVQATAQMQPLLSALEDRRTRLHSSERAYQHGWRVNSNRECRFN